MATVNVAGLVQSGWVRNVHVAFAVLVVYEHLLQMKNEVELFWTSRWSVTKYLFLWSRYFSLVLNVGDAIGKAPLFFL